MHVLLVHSNAEPAPDLVAALQLHHDVRTCALDTLLSADPADVLACVIEADLLSNATNRLVRTRLGELGEDVPRIFSLDQFDRRSFMAASALNAADFLGRPFEAARVQAVLGRHINRSLEASWQRLSAVQTSALKVSLKVFEDINNQAASGAPVEAAQVAESAESIVAALDQVGLDAWMQALRDHHRYTFRHVMFVTGTMSSAARLLGFTPADCQLAVSAGLMHDIGKARVPAEILDKPSKLDDSEWQAMRQHPRFGADILATGGWDADVIDVVLHHHERLDGAGYPDRLVDAQIKDFTRLVAISDVYSALVDKRAYKPAMTGSAAHETMMAAHGHLDLSMVKAFERIAKSVR